jgi:triacylglycerol esterase/lipase EstA (alpha/beta hydrolase family)
VHYIKLVYDENNIKHKYEWGQIKLDIEADETFEFENFFQFAELLKYKISLSRSTEQIDLICHSMGGLDSVAAIAVDKGQDATGTIYHSPIQGVNQLITVSTPHQGSPAANLSDTELAKVLMRQSKYIRTQGSNMRPTSDFIKLVNNANVRNQLLDRVSFMHMFGGGSDIVVPTSSYMIKTTGLGKSNYKIYPTLTEATHSQAMGITQDPRTALNIFKLLQA